MIWEDMIRKNMLNNIDQKLKTFAKRIIPVVWNYKPVVEIDESIWPKYDDLFSEIWFASAFKGATKSSEIIPNTQLHYENHLSWIQIIRYFPSPHKIKGIILTGWSRYDHMVPICEILPAGIPSLTLCLQTLINYNEEDDFIFSKSKEFTKCNYKQSPTGFIMDPTSLSYKQTKYKYNKLVNLYKCEFPGSNIYNWLLGLKLTITNFEKIHSNYMDRLSKYNIKYKFFNSMDFERAKTEFYPNYKELFEKFKQTGETSLDKYFYADLNEELINIYIIKYIDLIDETLAYMNKTSLPENAPVRPFNKIVQSML